MPWYYAGPESTPVGPLTTEELRARAAAGSLTPETYIIEHAEGATLAWRRFRDVFPAAVPEPPAAPVNVPAPTTHSVRLTVPSPASSAPPPEPAPPARKPTPAPVAPVPKEEEPVPRATSAGIAPVAKEEERALISPTPPAPISASVAAPSPSPAAPIPAPEAPVVAPQAPDAAPVVASVPAPSSAPIAPAPPAKIERESLPAPARPAVIAPAVSTGPRAGVGLVRDEPIAPPKREISEPAVPVVTSEPVAAKSLPVVAPITAVQSVPSSAVTVQPPLGRTLATPMPYPLRPTNGWCAWGFGLGLAGFCLSLICGIGVALAVPSLVLSAIGLIQVMRNRQQHGQALALAGLALSTLGVAVAVAYFVWFAVPIIRAHGLTVTEQTSNDSE